MLRVIQDTKLVPPSLPRYIFSFGSWKASKAKIPQLFQAAWRTSLLNHPHDKRNSTWILLHLKPPFSMPVSITQSCRQCYHSRWVLVKDTVQRHPSPVLTSLYSCFPPSAGLMRVHSLCHSVSRSLIKTWNRTSPGTDPQGIPHVHWYPGSIDSFSCTLWFIHQDQNVPVWIQGWNGILWRKLW